MIDDKLFWAKVEKKESGCWEWTGCKYPNGYGQVKRYKIRKNAIPTHRYAWYLKYGKFPDNGLYVLHKCDNRICVNHNHLFEGTSQDNMDDMVKKGRHVMPDQTGKTNHHAKLNDADVIEIRQLLKEGYIQKEIGEMFGVSRGAISCIHRGKNWTHI